MSDNPISGIIGMIVLVQMLPFLMQMLQGLGGPQQGGLVPPGTPTDPRLLNQLGPAQFNRLQAQLGYNPVNPALPISGPLSQYPVMGPLGPVLEGGNPRGGWHIGDPVPRLGKW